MRHFVEDSDLYITVFAELKSIGVKVPKVKKFKSAIPKQEKALTKSNDKIFGVSLAEQEWIAGLESLPKFLADTTAYLLKHSKVEGLFRKAGSVARQRKLRVNLENGAGLEGSDANDVASLLKQWLRELPEPLIPHYMQDLFIRCQHLDNEENRITATLLTCLLLPPDHLHTLKHLLCFLDKFASDHSENKMGAYNLALMMAPNIFVPATECADKTSNNLVYLHTSAIQLLIENANKIGEVRPSVSFQYSSQEGRSGSELDSSGDLLSVSPYKSRKKRKSGQITDIFNGIKKLVGQNAPSSSLKLTPEKYFNSRVTTSPKSTAKRKADPDQQILSAKKQAILQDNSEDISPKNKENCNLLNVETRSTTRSRRKSFGLLRRKEKKRKNSINLNSLMQMSLAPTISPTDNRRTSIVTINSPIQVTTSSDGCNAEKFSPLGSFDSFLKNVNMKKSASDCYLTASGKKFSESLKSNVVSHSNLHDKPLGTSPYWLRSDRKAMPEHHDSQHLDIENNSGEEGSLKRKNLSQKLQELMDKIEASSKKHDDFSIKLEPLPPNYAKVLNSETFYLSDQNPRKGSPPIFQLQDFENNLAADVTKIDGAPKQSFSRTDFNHNKKKSPQIEFDIGPSVSELSKGSGSTAPCSLFSDSVKETNNPLKKQNPNDVKHNSKGGITRQEAFIMKSRKNVENAEKNLKNSFKKERDSYFYSKEGTPDAKNINKNPAQVKLSKKASRNCSLVRGRPNSIKSGLPCQPLTDSFTSSNSIHKQDELLNKVKFPKYSGRHVSPKTDNLDLESKGLFPNMDDTSLMTMFETFKLSPNLNENVHPVDKNEYEITSSLPERKRSSKKKTKTRTNASFVIRYKSDRKLSLPLSLEDTNDNSDKKIHVKVDNNCDVIQNDSFSDGKQNKSPKSEANLPEPHESPLQTEINISCISTLEISTNDSCFESPNQVGRSSPDSFTWVSGNKYLGFDSPEEVFNKRESIARILKDKHGHVQEKVNLYDNGMRNSMYCTRSCSTPYSFSSTGYNSQSGKKQSSKKHPLDHKTLVTAMSYDSATKRIHAIQKSRSQKSPIPPPPKFVLEDFNTPSPNTSQPLKDVTNTCFGMDESQSATPMQDEDSFKKPSPNNNNSCDVDQKSKKLKSSSFSGRTARNFSKVTRSESSCDHKRQNNKLSKLTPASCNTAIRVEIAL